MKDNCVEMYTITDMCEVLGCADSASKDTRLRIQTHKAYGEKELSLINLSVQLVVRVAERHLQDGVRPRRLLVHARGAR